MSRLSQLSQKFNAVLMKALSVLAFVMVVIYFSVVLMRYAFGYGAVWIQNLVLYLHAFIFLLAAGEALSSDSHVRVDVLYSRFSRRTKFIVNKLGVLFFLWPLCGLILFFAWPYVIESWRIHEGSVDAGGLGFVYLLKTCILGFGFVLILQGLVILLEPWKENAEDSK